MTIREIEEPGDNWAFCGVEIAVRLSGKRFVKRFSYYSTNKKRMLQGDERKKVRAQARREHKKLLTDHHHKIVAESLLCVETITEADRSIKLDLGIPKMALLVYSQPPHLTPYLKGVIDGRVKRFSLPDSYQEFITIWFQILKATCAQLAFERIPSKWQALKPTREQYLGYLRQFIELIQIKWGVTYQLVGEQLHKERAE